jgi:branched-chain amino acid transport system substrate-binding protein
MAYGQFQAPQFAFPEALTGIQAEINHVNQAGGVNGRKINLIVCNDQGDPNVGADCGRKAVSDGVAAVIAGWSNTGPNILPILSAAGIPEIGSELNTQTDLTSKNVYAPDPAIAGASFGQGEIAVKSGCKKVAILTNPTASATLAAAENASAVKAAGGTVTQNVGVPNSLPSYSSSINTIASSGAQCLIPQVDPAEIPKVFTAIHESTNPTMRVIIESPEAAVLKPIGTAANGTLVESGSYLPPNANVKQFSSEFKAQDPSATVSSFAIDSWASALVLTNVLKNLSTVNPTTVTHALQSVRNMQLGPYAPVTFKPNTVAALRNLVNTNVLAYVYKNGNLTLAIKKPINVQGAVAQYGKSH